MNDQNRSAPTAPQQQARPPAARQHSPVLALLSDKSFKAQIAAALPKHMTADRMARVALTEVRKTPALMACDPAIFAAAIIQCSQLGLEPGNGLGHAYLIPFKTEVQLVIGYRGLIELVRRSGAVKSLVARAVRHGDDFDYAFGLEERLDHVPTQGKRGEVTFVYAVATLADGTKQFDVMSREQVEDIKRRSKSAGGNSSPWSTDFEEMAKKTIIRRIVKMLPLSPEVVSQVRAAADGTTVDVEFTDLGDDGEDHAPAHAAGQS